MALRQWHVSLIIQGRIGADTSLNAIMMAKRAWLNDERERGSAIVTDVGARLLPDVPAETPPPYVPTDLRPHAGNLWDTQASGESSGV